MTVSARSGEVEDLIDDDGDEADDDDEGTSDEYEDSESCDDDAFQNIDLTLFNVRLAPNTFVRE